MTYITLGSFKLRTSKGDMNFTPGQAVKLPDNLTKTLLERGKIEPQEIEVYGCAEGPQVCHKGRMRYCLDTKELEWFCQPKNEWCWKVEILKDKEPQETF